MVKRMQVVKKPIFLFFSCAFLMPLLVLTCSMFHSDSDYLDSTYYPDTNVDYSADGKFATIYFKGNSPHKGSVPSSQGGRALTRKAAEMAADYFEVVFMYNTGSTYVIARTSWGRGEPAGVSGVYRPEGAGVDYASTSPTPGATTGSAILFAGRKSDKTLLAVGKICSVSRPNASGVLTDYSDALINADTESVTFEVRAIISGLGVESETIPDNPLDPNYIHNSDRVIIPKAKVSSPTDILKSPTDLTSFLTSSRGAVGHRELSDVAIETTMFIPNFTVGHQMTSPMYRFENIDLNKNPMKDSANKIYFYGKYFFGPLSSPSTFVGIGYENSIILAGAGAVEKRRPQYTTNLGPVNPSSFILDTETVVTMENNQTVGAAFQNPVEFKFDLTHTEQGSVNSINFQIPVYALTSDPQGGEPVKWYIRPGYDNNLYDLDDGKGGEGGAILYGTGSVERYSESFGFKVMTPPLKWQYSNSDGWVFNVTGIELALVDGYGEVIRYINWQDPDVKFFLNGNPNNPLYPGVTAISTALYGFMPITVQYVDGNPNYDMFTVWCYSASGPGSLDLTNIPSGNIINVTSKSDIVGANFNTGTYILLLRENVDLSGGGSTYTDVNGSNVYILVMAEHGKDIKFTRSNYSDYFGLGGGNTNITMYFGGWPLGTSSLVAPVQSIYPAFPIQNAAKNYIINAANTGSLGTPIGNVPPPIASDQNNGFMFEMTGNTTPNLRVMIGPNMDVYNEEFLAENHVPGDR